MLLAYFNELNLIKSIKVTEGDCENSEDRNDHLGVLIVKLNQRIINSKSCKMWCFHVSSNSNKFGHDPELHKNVLNHKVCIENVKILKIREIFAIF